MENDYRLMVRLIAFILNANDDLVFCKGISQDDELSVAITEDRWKES